MAEKSSDSVVNVRLSYRQLDECRREMSDVIMSLQKECREDSERIRYLEDFIRYRNLEDEFRHTFARMRTRILQKTFRSRISFCNLKNYSLQWLSVGRSGLQTALQSPTKCSCNQLQNCFAINCIFGLQKTQTPGWPTMKSSSNFSQNRSGS